ncbi:MAG: cytochrome c peroxidase [Bacteroidota bacterium]
MKLLTTYKIMGVAGAIILLLTTSHPAKREAAGSSLARYELSLPKGFPSPPIPEDNPLTQVSVTLGKALFYDNMLSIDSSMSCASCHLLSAGLADHHPISVGIEGRIGFRNVPTLTNIAYHPYFFVEGGSPSLERQVLGPICNNDELGFNAADLAVRLTNNTVYQDLAMEAYGRPMDLFVLTRALASFERTMISYQSPYDLAQRENDPGYLSAEAVRGRDLFFSPRTACASCHSGPNFTNFSFENIGLETEYVDQGRYRVSLREEDIGKFKVPTLRNIGLTAPYMHDGRMESLEEVIAHYDQGGAGHINQHPLIKPLSLTKQEKQDLIAFLHSLTDKHFIQNSEFLLEP